MELSPTYKKHGTAVCLNWILCSSAFPFNWIQLKYLYFDGCCIMPVSNWEFQERNSSFCLRGKCCQNASASKAVCWTAASCQESLFGVLLHQVLSWEWILVLWGAGRTCPVFPEPPRVWAWACWACSTNCARVVSLNRLQNVLGNCSSSTLLCQLRKHRGSFSQVLFHVACADFTNEQMNITFKTPLPQIQSLSRCADMTGTNKLWTTGTFHWHYGNPLLNTTQTSEFPSLPKSAKSKEQLLSTTAQGNHLAIPNLEENKPTKHEERYFNISFDKHV